MITIKEIYEVKYQKDEYTFIGTLRNERKFNINDSVFVSLDGKTIFCSRIIGVEIELCDNPNYIYKVTVPKDLRLKLSDIDKIDQTYKLTCEYIFNSIDEAEKAALEYAEHVYNVQFREINKYFNQFKVYDNLNNK